MQQRKNSHGYLFFFGGGGVGRFINSSTVLLPSRKSESPYLGVKSHNNCKSTTTQTYQNMQCLGVDWSQCNGEYLLLTLLKKQSKLPGWFPTVQLLFFLYWHAQSLSHRFNMLFSYSSTNPNFQSILFFTTVLSKWDFSHGKFRLLSLGKAGCDSHII